MKVTVNRYLFFAFTGSVTFMELVQLFAFEEHIVPMCIDLLLMSFVGLFLCRWRLLIVLTVLVVFEVAETISFMVIGNGLDFQTINNIDMGFAWGLSKYYVIIAALACVLVYVCLRAVCAYTERSKEFADARSLTVSLPLWAVLALAVVSLSLFYMKEYYTFYPFLNPFNKPKPEVAADPVAEEEMLRDMDVSLNAKLNLTKVPAVKRNVIVVVMESIEKLCVGRLNPNARYMMPFVSNVSAVSPTFLGESQRFTDYSMAAMFAAMCGYPHINTPTLKRNMSPVHRTKKVKCVWDYLGAAGYRMYAKSTALSFRCGQMGRLMRAHGVKLEAEGERTHDFDVVNNSLASIKRHLKEGKPFMYMVLNMDTHYPYHDDPKCESGDRNPYKARRVINCLDCLTSSQG